MSAQGLGATQQKGGAFLLGSPGEVFAPEDFDSDARLMADTARQFAQNEVIPLLERLDAQEDGLMMGLVKKACDLGFGGPDTPEKYGGLGLSKAISTRILEMLSLNGSFATTIGVHQGVGQMPISLFGSETLKEKYLPKITAGEYMTAYALSEEKSGSDALNLTTRAVRDGGDFLLHGAKMWISNAKWAGTFVTFAKLDGDQITAFVVERDMPGVSISREEHKMGLKGSSTARLILENVRVPAENVVYREGQGHKVALNTLNLGRCKLAAVAAGQVRSALAVATRYAKERKQFGKPISSFGLIRDKIARAICLQFASESMLYRTANLIDEAFARVDPDNDFADENRTAAEEYQIECSLVKVFSTEALSYAVDEAVQIHGGYGFTEEFPASRLYRDARVMRIYEGTNEINRLFVADRLAKRGILEELMDTAPESPLHLISIQAAMAACKHLDSQEVAACLADIAMTHFAVQSSRARADRLSAMNHPRASLADAVSNYFQSIANAFAATRLAELLSRCGTSQEVAMPAVNFTLASQIAEAALEENGYPF